MPIKSLENLREHLQWAIEIEHATLPPYLCALYSIKEGSNQPSVEIITSVFIEEMLHMTLAANLLNAVGGSPVLDKPGFIATYPTPLPHGGGDFEVSLQKFSPEAIDTFLKIERPAPHDGQPQDENYDSIGQFYEAIEIGLTHLTDELGEAAVFTGDSKRQLNSKDSYYGGSGHIIEVTDLKSALAAMEEIIEQGEGHEHQDVWDGDRNMFHPEREEVGHYFRFQEIKLGHNYQKGDTPESGPTGDATDVDWSAVYDMKPNPSSKDYGEGTEIRSKIDAFNETYCDMLRMLERCFNGEPELLATSVGTMYQMKAQAVELMQMPSGDGTMSAGPTFEYMPATASASLSPMKIKVKPNGPYIIEGGVPLYPKQKIKSSHGDALAWQSGDEIETDHQYALCRCGQSASKPFCDGTHVRIGFDGTETASDNNIADREKQFEGHGITAWSDRSLCVHAAFCTNRINSWRKLVRKKDNLLSHDEINAHTEVIGMIEHCPSGTLTYTLDGADGKIEPRLPKEISVIDEGDGHGGPLGITGGIDVERSDGKTVETRNRMTLCRCGASKNKPFCDASHKKLNWEPGG